MRLFVGLMLDSRQQQALISMQKSLKAQQKAPKSSSITPNLKWTKPNNLHFTLKFIGEVSANQCALLKEALPESIIEEPLTFQFQQCDWFPNRRKPIVYAAQYLHSEATNKLIVAIEQAIDACSILLPQDKHSFKAHVTLARNKYRKSYEMPDKRIELPSLSFNQYHLILSEPTDTGINYSNLKCFSI